jgi:hypothetical protein
MHCRGFHEFAHETVDQDVPDGETTVIVAYPGQMREVEGVVTGPTLMGLVRIAFALGRHLLGAVLGWVWLSVKVQNGSRVSSWVDGGDFSVVIRMQMS